MSATLKILLIGDLFGKTGRDIFARHINTIRAEHTIDATIVNGENSADGKGITPEIAQFFKKHDVAVVTTGNHVWDKKDIIPYMSEHDTVLRPANYPDECPGTGMTFFTCKGYKVGVINLMGRTFMPMQLDCPLEKAQELVEEARKVTPIILVDMHAETTYEKACLGFFLDGKVSAVVGTHTHVQTADAKILPQGTAYLSDLGMGGSLNSMIGATKEPLIKKFLTQMPCRHGVATDAPYVLSGAVVTIDAVTGKALDIKTVYIVDSEPLG